MPGINPVTYPTDLAGAVLDLATNTATAPAVSSEPPLACYVTASCTTGAAASASAQSRSCKRKRGHHATTSKTRRSCGRHRKHRSA